MSSPGQAQTRDFGVRTVAMLVESSAAMEWISTGTSMRSGRAAAIARPTRTPAPATTASPRPTQWRASSVASRTTWSSTCPCTATPRCSSCPGATSPPTASSTPATETMEMPWVLP
eukprot:GHVL01010811.1.p3 GENE.GHVL01010811.1~~GHVL01010811.1.p3  ORF type:complete len:116 (+),score=19.17 GHVL01010811.1:744-1091(+)